MLIPLDTADSPGALLVPYPSMLDVSYELVEHVSWLIYARRRELNSPCRRLGCFKQALLALAHLRKNETFAQLAAGFGVSTATAWRYVDETLDILAAWAPGLHEALTGLGEGDHVIVDGPLIATDRIAAVGLIRFDGHSRSGVQPREDVHHGEHGEEEASPP
ncbi:transposase family protein, partial [Streptomyces griseus]|uniref:transposase family protein n=1 Tax=Streptomyces griseus TaxID=1911 RepID=UPI001F180828